jgi:hypothetical protein
MVQLKKNSKKNQPKRPRQNGWVQNDLSKMAFWSTWIGGKKNHDFCSGSKSRSQNKKNKNKNMTCVKQKSNNILSQ